jgi:hypothetical protein
MDKTFTDCYFAQGFTGGGWSYALNSNIADGEILGRGENEVSSTLSEPERRLAYYCIGWETVEVSGGTTMSVESALTINSRTASSFVCEDRVI